MTSRFTAIRRPKDAVEVEEVWQYYDTRSRQLLMQGFQWDGRLAWAQDLQGVAVETTFISDQAKPWLSYFVLPAHRGKGVMRSLTKAAQHPIITVEDCELAPILEHLGVAHHVAGNGILDSVEYDLVQEFYGDRKAKRSQVFLMNHIDEGLAVMNWAGSTPQAMRAFCLHPLLQNDADLAENFARVTQALRTIPDGATTLALAMEYRSVANEYLAHHGYPKDGGIRLSPIKAVNEMLIGDKVQNRKDFELYHADSHANRARLSVYFTEWCAALGITESDYLRLKDLLPGLRAPQVKI